MPDIDMSSAAVSRRLLRGSQLRKLGVGLAGPRRRHWSKLGSWEPIAPVESETPEAGVLKESAAPYRTGNSTP